MAHPPIGCCSWSLQPQGPRDLVETLRRLEIGAVQLALVPILEEPRWAGAFDEIHRAGIEIASGMVAFAGEDYTTLESIRRTGGLRPDATWPANRDRAAAAARLAGAAGIDLVSFHAGFLPPEHDDRERPVMLQRLRAAADLFGEQGVRVALETGQEKAATLRGFLAELDRPEVGVNFDPANMILYGMGDPVEALRALAPHLRQVHVKDALPSNVPGTWGREVPAGEGAVDWAAFFDTARRLDPCVRFVIEREAGQERAGDIARAAALVARHVPELMEDDRDAAPTTS